MNKPLPKTTIELTGDITAENSFSTSSVLAGIRKVKTTDRHTYRGIPEPEPTVESLTETVLALKEIIETLIGQRGQSSLHMLKVGDAEKLNDATVSYLIGRFTP